MVTGVKSFQHSVALCCVHLPYLEVANHFRLNKQIMYWIISVSVFIITVSVAYE